MSEHKRPETPEEISQWLAAVLIRFAMQNGAYNKRSPLTGA
jgi:hypothetical protein